MANQIIDKNDIIERVSKKVSELLCSTEEITQDGNLAMYGLDSMRTVELVVDLEEMFNITFDDEEMLTENFSTIKKIAERIMSKY